VPSKPAKSLTSSFGMNADLPASATPAPPAVQQPAPTPPPAAENTAPAAPPVAGTPAKTEKMAMLTPPPAAAPPVPAGEGVVATIPFAKEGANLPEDMLPSLVTLAKRAQSDPTVQLQVLAYASGDAENASKAQRLSLARALAVRAFLKDQGVPGARIDVRALGNRVPEGPPDRVDLVEQKH
jgi:outer membrane protein OmpA-like peptidoglycan-associated protein